MGQEWDGGDIAFRVDTWRRVFDVMKPGAHLIAFAATKGYHRMVCAIEDAGFEIRDMVPWLYGTGFPKSHNQDGEWEGWGTGLKPAIEPVVLAQKPISERSIEANLARWGVGALHIDACRVHSDDAQGGSYTVKRFAPGADVNRTGAWKQDQSFTGSMKPGRWPANLCHDGSDEVLAAFEAYGERGALAPVHTRNADKFRSVYHGSFAGNVDEEGSTFRGDSGSAARFFYSSKATQGERIFECRECGAHQIGKPDCGHTDFRTHPTVKPISLIRWYVEMVTPPGGLVLDPFAGTGTTAAAARDAGFKSLMIEADGNHARDIAVRLGLPLEELIVSEVQARPVNNGAQADLFAPGRSA
ncbi:site-specific DNA-methyltransferase (adenine-specific) [Sphingobium sp. B8D3C]|nr:site-specific DNA-methyltransferase (adenine-specific) [Sphingobium sp. B8D3B]MCW2419375.1 site-specific DNA-methyltransferase (adenine-specific) [Sphingobium sp. B8D3C]